jgi:hypothetical protein
MTGTDSADKPKRNLTKLGSRKSPAREDQPEPKPKVPNRKALEETFSTAILQKSNWMFWNIQCVLV